MLRLFAPVVALLLCAIGPAYGWLHAVSSSSSQNYPFTPLHTYYISVNGSDANDGLSPAINGDHGPWASPNHPVVCGDVVVVQPGTYTGQFSGLWGAVSSCPSTSGGIDGTGGLQMAILVCAGPVLGTCTVSGAGNGFDLTKSNWAIEGFAVTSPKTNKAFYVDACNATSELHHIAIINNVTFSTGYGVQAAPCAGVTPTFSWDYLAVVGNAAQSSNAQSNAVGGNCAGAVTLSGPVNADTVAGTHVFVAGNWIYANLGPTPLTACGTDLEGIFIDTWDLTAYTGTGVISNNLIYDNANSGIYLLDQQKNTNAPTIKMKNNTFFADSANLPYALATVAASEISFGTGAGKWTMSLTNDIALTNSTTARSSPNYASSLSNISSTQTGGQPTFSGNWLYGTQTSCPASATCLPGSGIDIVTSCCATSGTGYFTVSNGQILDPNGNRWLGYGIGIPTADIFALNAQLATYLNSFFPHYNLVRIAGNLSDTPAQYDAFVNALPAGTMVVIEHHDYSGTAVLTGTALTNETNWYVGMYQHFSGNKYVVYQTMNEPGAGDALQMQATYNGLRQAGYQGIIFMEAGQGAGGCYSGNSTCSIPLSTSLGSTYASVFAPMVNVAWDMHFYNWQTNSSDIPTILADQNNRIAAYQAVSTASGVMPVMSIETGTNTNATAPTVQQEVTATYQNINQHIQGAAAWEWENWGGNLVNSLTQNNGGTISLSSPYGANVASYILACCLPTGGGGGGSNFTPAASTYVSPAFTNTTDLLANWVGSPAIKCSSAPDVVSCMGWSFSNQTATSLAPISDLDPTANGTAGKGYQPPGNCVASDADYPAWLKGVVFLKMPGQGVVSGFTEMAGLVTKPCGN